MAEGNERELGVPKILFIRAEWDDEANVWVATSDDVSGLATEAETIEALNAKLQRMVPELLEANGCLDSQGRALRIAGQKIFCGAHLAG